MAERERLWRDVIVALEADIMILEGIEHRHPEIELRPTITNIHLAIQGIMDLITESQGGEPTPEVDVAITGPPTLTEALLRVANVDPPPESDVTEPPPVSGVDTTVERLEADFREAEDEHARHYYGDAIARAVAEKSVRLSRDALTLIHDLQVEAASQERWADEYKAERDKLREVLQWCAEQVWEGGDIEVGDFQDAMLNAELLVEVEADEDFKAEWDTEVMYVVAWSPLAGEQKQ